MSHLNAFMQVDIDELQQTIGDLYDQGLEDVYLTVLGNLMDLQTHRLKTLASTVYSSLKRQHPLPTSIEKQVCLFLITKVLNTRRTFTH